MNSVEKYIFENYRALVENAGFSVYYVEFQKSHKDSILRLYIEPKDADQTMDIDACEVVSRLLKYFAQEGWVRLYRGSVEVLDKQKLQEIARGQ